MQKKNPIIALVLAMFLGFFGVDRFYLGKKTSGILKLITFGGLSIPPYSCLMLSSIL